MRSEIRALWTVRSALVLTMLLPAGGRATAAVVETAIDTVTLTDHGDGTKTISYTFSVTQAFAPLQNVSVTPSVWFVEDDTISCDDNIATKPAPTLTIMAGQIRSNTVTVSHRFDPRTVEDSKTIQFHVEVHATDGLAGTGDGIFDFPAEEGSGDPPPGSEPEDFCDLDVQGEPGTPYQGTTAAVSVTLGSSLSIDPVDLPRLADVAPEYERLEACLVEDSGFAIACFNLATNGRVPGVEEIGLETQDVSTLGYPAMTVFDISGIPDFATRVDRVEISAVDDDLVEPPLVVMVAGFPQPRTLCLDFNDFCDGFELTKWGAIINGFWRNTDCAGADVEFSLSLIRPRIPSPCGGTGNAAFVCSDNIGFPPCQVVGADWYFVLDGLDGTMDMGSGNPPGSCWIDQLAYSTIMGPCPFKPEVGERPLSSTTH